MIADIKAGKKVSSIVTESLLRRKQLNISLAFISQSYFNVPKTIRISLGRTYCKMKPIQKKSQNN